MIPIAKISSHHVMRSVGKVKDGMGVAEENAPTASAFEVSNSMIISKAFHPPRNSSCGEKHYASMFVGMDD